MAEECCCMFNLYLENNEGNSLKRSIAKPTLQPYVIYFRVQEVKHRKDWV